MTGIQRQRDAFSWRFSAELPIHLPGTREFNAPGGFPGTHEDWVRRTAGLDSLLNQLHKEGFDSRSIWGQGKDALGGTNWSPERQAQHQQIINEFIKEMEGIPAQRKAILMAGLGGAGKTSVRENDWAAAPLSEYFDLSADKVKEKMAARGMIPNASHDPRLKGYSPMELSSLTHVESNDIAAAVAKEAMRRGTNSVWDYRMGDLPGALGRIKSLNDNGYKNIGAFLVNITPQEAQTRAIHRHMIGQQNLLQDPHNPENQGGRWFPNWAQRENAPQQGSGYDSSSHEVFSNLTQNYSDLLPMGWGAVDNNADPTIIGGTGNWSHFNDLQGQAMPSEARRLWLSQQRNQKGAARW